MNRKSRIIISITGIVIIILALLGLTYGYYINKITGNETAKSVEVITGDSSVRFTDLSESDISGIIEPGFTMKKTFTVENTGNISATYSIFFVDVYNDFVRTEDVIYTLYRIDNESTFPTNYEGCIENPTDEKSCKIVVNSAEFPTEVALIKANETITTPEDVFRYDLVITYINHPTINQNVDQGHTFSGKVNIRASYDDLSNPFSEGTLAYNILNNGAIVEKVNIEMEVDNDCVMLSGMGYDWCLENGYFSSVPTFTNEFQTNKNIIEKASITSSSDGSNLEDNGLFKTQDDYGTSYYYRGAIRNNYVKFAGFTWRIIRINGDGSIRLILEGTFGTTIRENETEVIGDLIKFNSVDNDNAYVGYMYGLANSTTDENRCLVLENDEVINKINDINYSTKDKCEMNNGKWATTAYEATHINVKDSFMKTTLDNFYETYIENDTYKYGKYLSDSIFCADKTLASNGIGGVEEQLGYGNNETYYSSTERLEYSENTTFLNTAYPILKCAKNASDDFSRYTVEKHSFNDITTNGDLTYPIGLINADELILAGAFRNVQNRSYYLNDAERKNPTNANWWTMTPNYYLSDYSSALNYTAGIVGEKNTFYSLAQGNVLTDLGTRPVINLKSGIEIGNGNGLENSPYEIKEIS